MSAITRIFTRNVTLWGGLFLESRPSISGPFPCPRAAAAARGARAPRRHRRASRIGSNTSLHGGCGHSAIPVLLRARAVVLGLAQCRNVPAGPFRARAVGCALRWLRRARARGVGKTHPG